MGAWWLLLGLGLVPWQNGWTSLGVDGQILQGSNQVLAISVLGLNPWSEQNLVKGQLFGAGGEANFGFSDFVIGPRVDSDISDYYYDYQDQVCVCVLLVNFLPFS